MNIRIKKLRKELDLTQQAFAERIGLKQNSIALIESGKRNISTQAILSICREFNVNEEWLRTGVGEMFVPINLENQLIEWAGKVFRERDESFKKRFVAMLMDLSEDKWELLEEMARKLVDVGDTQRTSEESKEEFAACFTVHLDEATPHMHFNFVPVTPDGRLSAKDVLTKQSLTEQQTAFHEAVGAKYGLQRGEPKGSGKRRQHMETAEYKAYAAELAEARQRAETAQRATQALDSRVHVLQGDVKALEGQRERLSADLAETSQRAGEAHQRAAQEQGAVKALESRRDALRDEVGGLQREVAVLEQNRDKLLAQSPGWSLAEVKKQVEIDRKLSRLEQLERFLDAHFPRWRDLFQTFQRQQGRDRDTGRDR